jgi:hypothetical protein
MMGRVFFFFPWERALPAATANESVSPSIAGRLALPTFRCGLTMPKPSRRPARRGGLTKTRDSSKRRHTSWKIKKI